MTAASDGPTRRGAGLRFVLLAGITIGTALLVTAYWQGWRPAIPGLPPVAGLLAGGLAAWLVAVAAASVAAGLLGRHHRALARHTARGAGRASMAAARAAGRGGRSASGWLAAKAGPRWQARSHRPLMLIRTGNGNRAGEAGPTASRRPDGQPETETDRRFFDLRESGWTGPIDQDSQAVMSRTSPDGQPLPLFADGTGTGTPDDPRTRAARPAAASRQGERLMTMPAGPRPAGRATAPDQWKSLVAATADFEPEDDAQLLEWMAGEVAGVSAYAEALTEVYETCVNSLGVDPAAMNAVHDTADAAADAATAMAYARQKFAAHYAEVREFAASGGLLPFDGRWITGDGDA